LTRTLFAALASLLVAATLAAQTTGRLSRVIPELYGPQGLIVDSLAPLPSGETHSGHFNSAFQSEFTQFNIALASQVASIPIPSPGGGFTYTFDPAAGVFVRSTESFGPIFTQRADTIGRHKLSFSFAYQHFGFDQIEGLDLDDIPAVFTHDDPQPGGRSDLVTTVNHIDASVDQFTAFFTYGLTDRIDVTAAVPVISAELAVTSDATIRRIGTTDPKVHFFYGEDGQTLTTTRTFRNQADATGIGDIRLQVKGLVLRQAPAALALGLDVRVPSGDADDLLGTGALGVRPFAALSMSGKLVSAHLNLGYQWNGDSVLAGDVESRREGDLPDQLGYAASVDFAVNEHVTLDCELLGQIVYDSPRILPAEFTALDGRSTFGNIAFGRGAITETGVATGMKVNLFRTLLLTLNALFAIDDGGLRDDVTPLFGLEYSF
jgi:hypothetical protein